MRVTHINPEGLIRNPAFTQVVAVDGAARTVYVGGQNGVDAEGRVAHGMAAQARQAMRNLEIALHAAGATLADVVKWSVYLVAGQPLAEAFAAAQEAWGERANPPAISVLLVAGLANPAFLVEIEAVAVVEPRE